MNVKVEAALDAVNTIQWNSGSYMEEENAVSRILFKIHLDTFLCSLL